nr:AraC family transcriptional regulator [Hyphomicrobiales bacterium]
MPDYQTNTETRLLARLIEQNTGKDGIYKTSIPRLYLMRSSQPIDTIHAVYDPSVCMVAQGRKRVIAGETIHHYDSNQYLVSTVDIPAVGQIIDVSPDYPFLCLKYDLDPVMISSLIVDAELPDPHGDQPVP